MADPEDLAGALHDVSNALTVLLGWVGEARAPGADAEAVAYALTIVEQRARIARDLARRAIGAPGIDEQREIGAIVEELAAALKVEAQSRGVRLVARGADATAKVEHALEVSQILTNLVLNGLAFAPRGGSVEVSVDVDRETCVIEIADDGPGVSLDRRERIFRGESTRPGGTGVGLRHSRAIARQHGGDIALVDRDGRAGPQAGATFRVAWPRADAVPRPPVSVSRVSDLSGLRVLVVEDDVAVTQLLEAALEARGAHVTLAADAGRFERALGAEPFDAALVDLSPISADATGAIARLRESSPAARIVLITGSADALPQELASRIEHGGALSLVRKPFEVREIAAALAPAAKRPA